MTAEQRAALDTTLRAAPLDLGGDLKPQREIFRQMMSAVPLAADVETTPSQLGGVPVVNIAIRAAPAHGVILYFHGGAYAIGSAILAAGLASDIGRRARTKVVSVDYRLAPEHPYPAAIDDAVAAYRALLADGHPSETIVFAGESAGGGVVAATLVALKDTDLPQPAAAYIISPWLDLTLSGETLQTNAAIDPSLTPEGLLRRQKEYVGANDASSGYVSPIFANLTGLPPVLIQVGGNEILLSDSTRMATKAAEDQVAVVLEATPGVPHVFVAFAGILDEADAALDSGARFLREHLNN